jgi:hypothetical protein
MNRAAESQPGPMCSGLCGRQALGNVVTLRQSARMDDLAVSTMIPGVETTP